MLQSKSQLSTNDIKGCKELLGSIRVGKITQAQLLLDLNEINLNIISKEHDKTPLMLACKKGYVSLVSEMITNPKCNPLVENSKGRNCFVYSVKYAHLEIIKLLETYSRIKPIFKIRNNRISDHFNINMLLLATLTSDSSIVNHFLNCLHITNP